MHEAIHTPCILGWNILSDIEILDFTRDLAGKGCRIKPGDTPDAGFTGEDVLPRCRYPDTDWCDGSKAGHDDSAFSQAELRYSKETVNYLEWAFT